MHKFTPGPWIVRNSNGAPTVWTADKVYKVAACTVVGTGAEAILKKEQRYGNANLIAATPDLLEALKAYVRDSDKHNWPHGCACFTCQTARAAIAKAEGRQP